MRLLALILSSFVLCSGTALAQTPKIGFVDAVKLVETAPQGEKSLRALQEEFSPRDVEIRDMRAKVRDMESDLEKNALVMSQGDIDKKRSEIQVLRRKLQRLQQEFKEDYSIRRNEELKILQRIVTEAIIEIAEQEGYDLIVQQAVYRSERIDITEKVLEKLGK